MKQRCRKERTSVFVCAYVRACVPGCMRARARAVGVWGRGSITKRLNLHGKGDEHPNTEARLTVRRSARVTFVHDV